jgi:hypothetical protein
MTQDELTDAIWALEFSERAALLVCSIIDKNKHNPVAPVLAIVDLTNVMASYLNSHDRVRVANALRDCADLLEHKKQVVVS